MINKSKNLAKIIAIIFILNPLINLQAKNIKNFYFLSPTIINIEEFLPNPPLLDSREALEELSLVYKAGQNKSDNLIKLIKSEDKITIFAFADVISPSFNAKLCPKTAKLFKQISDEAGFFIKKSKKFWQRPRPYIIDNKITTIIKEAANEKKSYPSGHSTLGQLYAEILINLMPEKKLVLLKKGQEIGWNRVIAGLHYPSDIYAGRFLGHILAKEMLNNLQLQASLKEVAAELENILN
jgi:acid phosphatase (class A)